MTQPRTLQIPLSSHLESRDKILHVSLEMWLEAAEGTQQHPTLLQNLTM